MKKTIILRGDIQKQQARAIIDSLPLEPVHEIRITEHKANRSAAQNRLMWQWLTVIAGETGNSKEDLHEEYKGRFLAPIYERDDQGYAEMMAALRDLYRSGHKDAAFSLRRQVVRLTSTTTATVEQMSEYLGEIERNALTLGVVLPRPEDLYREALGDAA